MVEERGRGEEEVQGGVEGVEGEGEGGVVEGLGEEGGEGDC